jgi:hypothetical protein
MCTHNSIWLFDDRENITSSACLEGFDVSFDSAPPTEALPSNVALRHWDVRKDIPDDLVGVFDLIHVRFFSFVLLLDEVPLVIGKLFRMLSAYDPYLPTSSTSLPKIGRVIYGEMDHDKWYKRTNSISLQLEPGGFLQWGDPDIESIRVDKTSPEVQTESLTQMFKLLAVQDPRLKPTWVTDLPNLFSQAGFVEVEVDKRDCAPHWGFLLHECGLMIHELIYRKTKNLTMQQELGRLLPQAVEETRRGAYVMAVRWTVIGKKPEA